MGAKALEEHTIIGSFYVSYDDALDAKKRKDAMMGLGRYDIFGLFRGSEPIGYLVIENTKLRI